MQNKQTVKASSHLLEVQSLLCSHLSSLLLQLVYTNGVVHIHGSNECSGEGWVGGEVRDGEGWEVRLGWRGVGGEVRVEEGGRRG